MLSCSKEDELSNLDPNESLQSPSNNYVTNSSTQRGDSGINITPEEASVRARISMVDFVEGVKPYYSEGMSYLEFKQSLNPANYSLPLVAEAEDLLIESYMYLVRDTGADQMDGSKLVAAYKKGFEMSSVGRERLEDITALDQDQVFKELFNLPDDYTDNYTTQGCAWYQVGCHLGWLWGEVSGWWSSPSNPDDDDSPTNGEVVTEIASAISTVLTILAFL